MLFRKTKIYFCVYIQQINVTKHVFSTKTTALNHWLIYPLTPICVLCLSLSHFLSPSSIHTEFIRTSCEVHMKSIWNSKSIHVQFMWSYGKIISYVLHMKWASRSIVIYRMIQGIHSGEKYSTLFNKHTQCLIQFECVSKQWLAIIDYLRHAWQGNQSVCSAN